MCALQDIQSTGYARTVLTKRYVTVLTMLYLAGIVGIIYVFALYRGLTDYRPVCGPPSVVSAGEPNNSCYMVMTTP